MSNDSISREKLLHTFEGWLKLNGRAVPTEIGKAVYMMIENFPAVPHEMTAREYIHTFKIMCEHARDCTECPLNGLACGRIYSAIFQFEETIPIIEAWAREHPETMVKERNEANDCIN